MPNSWQPTPQECALIADMLDANRPKAAIAKFLHISETYLAAIFGQGAASAAPRRGVAARFCWLVRWLRQVWVASIA
jgi:hypothetical protein